MLDFFSLARGYGLGLGFAMASIFFWLKYMKEKDTVPLFSFLLFSWLGVLSNFSLLNLYLGLVGLSTLINVNRAYRYGHYKIASLHIALIIVVSVLVGLSIYQPLSQLIDNKELFFGGNRGLWNDTLKSLVSSSAYLPSGQESWKGILVFSGPVMAILIGLSFQAVRSFRVMVNSSQFHLCMLLGGILVGLHLQHSLFGTRFLIERTALFLVPIFMLLFFSVLMNRSKGVYGQLGISVLFIASVIMFCNTIQAANLSYTRDWKHEEDLKEMMTKVKNEDPKQEVFFGINWPFTSTCNFYKWLYKYEYLRIVENPASVPWNNDTDETGFYDVRLDVVFVKRAEEHLFPRSFDKQFEYADNTVLAFFDRPDCKENIIVGEPLIDVFGDSFTEQYTQLFEQRVGSFVEKGNPLNVKLHVQFDIEDMKKGKDIFLVMIIQDSVNIHLYKTSTIPVTELCTGLHDLFLYHRAESVSDDLIFKVSLWNRDQMKVKLNGFTLTSLDCN